jgi:hypothetical protein
MGGTRERTGVADAGAAAMVGGRPSPMMGRKVGGTIAGGEGTSARFFVLGSGRPRVLSVAPKASARRRAVVIQRLWRMCGPPTPRLPDAQHPRHASVSRPPPRSYDAPFPGCLFRTVRVLRRCFWVEGRRGRHRPPRPPVHSPPSFAPRVIRRQEHPLRSRSPVAGAVGTAPSTPWRWCGSVGARRPSHPRRMIRGRVLCGPAPSSVSSLHAPPLIKSARP